MNSTTRFLSSPAALALLAVSASSSARLDAANPDMVSGDASAYAIQTISMQAAASVQTWVEAEDIDDGEGAADRLIAMLVGIADENKDGELSDEEQDIVELAAGEAWSYLSAKGVADSDLEAMFNADDPTVANEAGARIREFLADALPDGDEAGDDEVDNFTFGAEARDAVFDEAGNVRMDAVYKKRIAVRQGKKVIIRKRVAGTIRLSAKQKVSIRKARMKSHGSRAMAKRMKSLRVRKSYGLNKR